ncbi:MAG: methyltransferase domain-containing protein [Pirellulaceae bacterium]
MKAATDPSFWDAMADDYEIKAHPFSLLFVESMLEEIPLEPGTRLLDVATGTGAAAILAAERGAEVVAIDFSEGMLERLRVKQLPGISALQMDGQALDLEDNSFDVTVSVFGVMLFEDWNKGLKEMARVTKQGGTTAVVTWSDPNGAGIRQIIAPICGELFPDLELPPPPQGMATLSDPENLKRAMRSAGFNEPKVIRLSHRYHFTREAIFQGNPIRQRLSESQQQKIVEVVKERFQDRREGDSFYIESEALLAIATKP